jgi:hypothetical protein
MPFSPTASEKNWTEVFEGVFQASLEECGYSCTRAETSRGSLKASIVEGLVGAYGHLVPGADIGWVDKLDALAASPQVSASHTQPEQSDQGAKASQLLENISGPARIRTWDQRIMSRSNRVPLDASVLFVSTSEAA